MGSIEDIKNGYVQSIKILADRSRIEAGGAEVSLHCDKFNTRILKGLEDVAGFEKAREIIATSAEKTTIDLLNKYLDSPNVKEAFASFSVDDRLKTIFEIFKVLGYGALNVESVGETSGKFVSKSTYISEGWLENEKKWKWSKRNEPVCHDVIGYLQGALVIVYGKPPGTFSVKEITCRAKGDPRCEFQMEAK
jgi:predicted hydrocarbon binding protein